MSEHPASPPARRRRRTQSPAATRPSVAERFDVFSSAPAEPSRRSSPTLLAFLIGGLVIVVTTGHNPLSTYQAIFNGTGLSWFFHPGSYHIDLPFTDTQVWFPWNTTASSRVTPTRSSRRCC